jgi:dihydroorotase
LNRGMTVSGSRVEVAGSLTVGLRGDQMSELGLMVDAGAVALSDGRKPMMNAALLRRSLDYARPFGVPVIMRPGDTDLEGAGVMHEGKVSTQIGLRGIPAASEEIGVGIGIALARLTGAKIHLSQVTTAGSVDLLRAAKASGVAITAAVPARHLVLTDRTVDTSVYDTATRLLPPLRSDADRAAVRAGVADGTIDCITADHVPMTSLEKELEYMHAKPGAMGLETAFSAAMVALDDVSLVVSALAVGPAAVIGRTANLTIGSVADVVVLDSEAPRTVSGPYRSKGLNEPLEGAELKGQVVATVRDGCIIYGPKVG